MKIAKHRQRCQTMTEMPGFKLRELRRSRSVEVRPAEVGGKGPGIGRKTVSLGATAGYARSVVVMKRVRV